MYLFVCFFPHISFSSGPSNPWAPGRPVVYLRTDILGTSGNSSPLPAGPGVLGRQAPAVWRVWGGGVRQGWRTGEDRKVQGGWPPPAPADAYSVGMVLTFQCSHLGNALFRLDWGSQSDVHYLH